MEELKDEVLAESAIVKAAQDRLRVATERKLELELKLKQLTHSIAELKSKHETAALLRQEEEKHLQEVQESGHVPPPPTSFLTEVNESLLDSSHPSSHNHPYFEAALPIETSPRITSTQIASTQLKTAQIKSTQIKYARIESADIESIQIEPRRNSQSLNKKAHAFLIKRREEIKDQLEKDFKQRRAKAERMKRYSVLIKSHFTPPLKPKPTSRTSLPKGQSPAPKPVAPYSKQRSERAKHRLDKIHFFNPMWENVSSDKNIKEQPNAVLEYANAIEKIARKRALIAKSVAPMTSHCLSVEADVNELLIGSIRTKIKLLCNKYSVLSLLSKHNI